MFITMLLGTKWVAMARHGLILWENEATSLGIIFKCLPGLRDVIKTTKHVGDAKHPENQKHINYEFPDLPY